MKTPAKLLCITLMFWVGHSLMAVRQSWTLAETVRVDLPESYVSGEPFEAEIEFFKAPEAPQQLSLSFHYLKDKGAFAGGLQHVPQKTAVTEAGTHRMELRIDQTKPDLRVALLTIYLSPDGSWENRTLKAAFPIMPTGGDRALYAKAVQRAGVQEIAKPQHFPPYHPPQSYFDQRVDTVGIRDWKPDPQSLPNLGDIIERPAPNMPVYGIYCWAEEYARAADEVEKIGIRSIRLSGPWHQAGRALELAARNRMEVMYTLRGGDTGEAFRQKRDKFDSDDAFIANFTQNVRQFLNLYGPGGTFFRNQNLASPIRMVEIWNEPNFQYMIADSGKRKEDEALREALYAKLLPAGYEAVKAVAPEVLVGGFATGGSASGDVRFIQNVLESNPSLIDRFDVLSTHPYTMGAPPEGQKYRKWGSYSIANNLEEIRSTLASLGQPGKPIWYTEIGWQFSQEHGGAFSDRKHQLDSMVTPDLLAAYTVRNYLWAIRLGVERVFVMHMFDSDHYNCGFFDRQSLRWRPWAYAVQNQINLLPNPKLIGAQSDGEDLLYIYDFIADHQAPDGARVSVVWRLDGPGEASVAAPPGDTFLVDLMGEKREVEVHDGRVKFTAGPYPVYVVTE